MKATSLRVSPSSAAAPPLAAGKAPGSTMSKMQFDAVRSLAFERAGLSILEAKHLMVQRRIQSRVEALGLPSVAAYLNYLSGPGQRREMQAFINVLTTNKTYFFREPEKFAHLRDHVLRPLCATKSADAKRTLRIWAAGCSSGEEAWSIAMTVAATLEPLKAWDVRILASDIDTDILEQARCGVYPRQALETVPRTYQLRFFKPAARTAKTAEVHDGLRRLVTFQHFNLHGAWPTSVRFDAIFCRNVMIYFDKPSQKILLERFADALTHDGFLYSGSCECLHGLTPRLVAAGRSIYRRAS